MRRRDIIVSVQICDGFFEHACKNLHEEKRGRCVGDIASRSEVPLADFLNRLTKLFKTKRFVRELVDSVVLSC